MIDLSSLDPEILDAAVELGLPEASFDPGRVEGQRQYLESKHRIRAFFVGNRYGKTTCAGIDWTRFSRAPDGIGIWVCPQYKQLDILRPDLQRWFDIGWVWNASDNLWTWPNGSKLYVISADRDWTYIQGINPDRVYIDEQCPLPLWRELLARGAGTRDTRYSVQATATEAESWMEHAIYRPWLEHHAAQGLTEAEAMRVQNHPSIWCWPVGGIDDNSTISQEQREHFKGISWGSDKERQVRTRGGFMRLVGDAVFSAAGLDWLREKIRAARYHGVEVKP